MCSKQLLVSASVFPFAVHTFAAIANRRSMSWHHMTSAASKAKDIILTTRLSIALCRDPWQLLRFRQLWSLQASFDTMDNIRMVSPLPPESRAGHLFRMPPAWPLMLHPMLSSHLDRRRQSQSWQRYRRPSTSL